MSKPKIFKVPFNNDVVVTIPDQSFTPRQIIEQFARNEVVPSSYSPSDTIDDSVYSEEQMVEEVIEFEDPIDAENHLIENQYALQFEADEGKSAASESSDGSPKETVGDGEGNTD